MSADLMLCQISSADGIVSDLVGWAYGASRFVVSGWRNDRLLLESCTQATCRGFSSNKDVPTLQVLRLGAPLGLIRKSRSGCGFF